MEALGYIALIAGLVLAARFVGNTRDTYSACCGRGCGGCKTYAQERARKLKEQEEKEQEEKEQEEKEQENNK